MGFTTKGIGLERPDIWNFSERQPPKATRQVALAWLLQRSPNILMIAGTPSVVPLKTGALKIPPEIVAQLDEIGAAKCTEKSQR